MSSIQFYSDDNCLDLGSLRNTTGTPDGLCTSFGESAFKSFRVVTLERTCAVTIYGSDLEYCSSAQVSIANFGACMTNTTVNQFSVDCQDYNIATSDAPASYVSPAATRTNSPSSPASASPSNSALAEDGLSTGAKAGIGIGIALVVVLLIAGGVFFVIRRRRSARKAAATTGQGPQMGELHGDNRRPTEAPPGYSEDGGRRQNTNVAYWQKTPRTPNAAPVEAEGDHNWRGGLHEMESPMVTETGTLTTGSGVNSGSSALPSALSSDETGTTRSGGRTDVSAMSPPR